MYHYYLFYDLGEHSYHSPISEKEVLEKHSDLEIIKIDMLNTQGHDITDLISNQFVEKLLTLIDSGNYTLEL